MGKYLKDHRNVPTIHGEVEGVVPLSAVAKEQKKHAKLAVIFFILKWLILKLVGVSIVQGAVQKLGRPRQI